MTISAHIWSRPQTAAHCVDCCDFRAVALTIFLFSLDDLNDRVDLALPDLQLPQIMVIPQTIDRVHVRVSQTWSGFAYVLQGLLSAMADDYGTLVFLDVRRDITDSACIEVILIENNFSAGINFDMIGGAR